MDSKKKKKLGKKNLRATFSIHGTVCALFTSERGKTELNIFDSKPTPVPISPCIATGQYYFVDEQGDAAGGLKRAVSPFFPSSPLFLFIFKNS